MKSNIPHTNPLSSSKAVLISQNIRALQSKINDLKSLANDLDPEIICLQETWHPPHEACLNISGYQKLFLRVRTGSRGGGIGTYFKLNLLVEEIQHISIFLEGTYESQAFKVRQGEKKSFLLINAYRPPSGDVNRALEELSSQLDFANSTDTTCLIVGDFNINWDSNSAITERYKELLANHGFINLITEGTRLGPNNASNIDHILVKAHKATHNCGVEDFFLSDHKAVWASLDLIKNKAPGIETAKHNLSKNNINKLKTALRAVSWDTCPNADKGFQQLQTKIKTLLDEHCPKVASKRGKKKEPWFNSDLAKQKILLRKLSKKATTRPTLVPVLKTTINNYKKDLRKAKQAYYSTMLDKFRHDGRSTWRLLNSLLGRVSTSASPGVITIDNCEITDPTIIANHFNNYYSTIGSELAKKVQPGPAIGKYKPQGITVNPLSLKNISIEEVSNSLQSLEPKTSAGFDEISNKVLKECKHELLPTLVKLINQALEEGKFPTNLKLAKVIYLSKGGELKDVSNWRPISLLSCVGKIFEKVINKRIMDHMSLNNLWSVNQFGFRPGHSTTHAVLKVISKIQEATRNGKWVMCIFIDVAKAFNCMDPSLLAEKLGWYGLNNQTTSFIKSYLSDRMQTSLINGTRSEKKLVELGTPQGGSLSTTAYIIYNNDLQAATDLECILFADDTTLIGSYSSEEELIAKGNKEIAKVEDWFRANKLTLNAKKTLAAIFKPARINKKTNCEGKLFIDNHPLQIIGSPGGPESVKFLGIHIDAKLNFKLHTDKIKAKIKQGLFALNQAKHYLNESNRLKVYHALIQPHIDYGSIIWTAEASKASIDQVGKLQKRAVRLIKKADYRAHTDNLFKNLGILKVSDILEFEGKCLQLAQIRNGLPLGVSSLFAPKKSHGNTRSNNSQSSEAAIINKLTQYWNLVPQPANNSTLKSAKKYLKKSFTTNYKTGCKGCVVCT
jgi:endonuclease/exonuclease/phosphatase (EEP) superfamily protein YafD